MIYIMYCMRPEEVLRCDGTSCLYEHVWIEEPELIKNDEFERKMKIRIDIRYDDIWNKFHSETWLSHNIVKKAKSENLNELLSTIKEQVLEYQKETAEK